MLADKKPFYRPRVGHWHDKQITQPWEKGSPLGPGGRLMEDQGAEEKEEKIPQARLSSFQLQRHPGWAHSPGGTATSDVQSSPPQIKPTGEGPRAWLRKRATLGRNGGQGAQRLRKKERGLPQKNPTCMTHTDPPSCKPRGTFHSASGPQAGYSLRLGHPSSKDLNVPFLP